jgi:hypothetical protein
MFRLWAIGHQPAYTLEPHLNFNHFNPEDEGKISFQKPVSTHKTTQYQNPDGHNPCHAKLKNSQQ